MYKGSHALIIGVSDYKTDWPDLENIPREIDKVEEALNKHGFNIVKVMNPNNETLEDAYKDFIDKYGYDEQNKIMWEAVNNSTAAYARIEKLIEEISSNDKLSNSSEVEINSILSVMYTIANKYQEPLEEFKGVSDFIDSELKNINVRPDRKRDYFLWLIRKKDRKRILDNYRQKGRKEAFEEAQVKLDTAYQKASITMASYALEIREQLSALKEISIVRFASKKRLLEMLNQAKNVLGTNEKVLYLRDEAIEKLPISLK
jgi:hypothetical protein